MTSKKDNITCNIKVRQCLYMTKVVHQTRAYLCFPSIKRLFITPPWMGLHSITKVTPQHFINLS